MENIIDNISLEGQYLRHGKTKPIPMLPNQNHILVGNMSIIPGAGCPD
jgi:hypothetical protein